MIEVKELAFSYTKKAFIEGMDFRFGRGDLRILGPSGAGKSTLQKILIGLLRDYQGSVKVNGVECREHNNGFYEQIGVDFEFSTMYEKMTAEENLRFLLRCTRKRGGILGNCWNRWGWRRMGVKGVRLLQGDEGQA